MKRLTLFLPFLLIIISCNTTKIRVVDCTNPKENCPGKTIMVKDLDRPLRESYNTVLDFYTWYNEYHDTLNQDALIHYSNKKNCFTVDLEYASHYLHAFETTNFLSQNLIGQWYTKFKKDALNAERRKVKQPQDISPDYQKDFIYKERVPNLTLKKKDFFVKSITRYSEDKIEIKLEKPFWYIKLVRNSEFVWQIDSL